MLMNVVIFACQQAVPDQEALRALWKEEEIRLRLLSEPCSSKVEAFQLLRTLATPVDLVWVIGCAETLCRYQEGSHRLVGRVHYTQRYLEEIGLEPERLGHCLVTPGDQGELAAVAGQIQAQVRALGPTPLRPKTAASHLANP
jgi:F420-non-reducing hydrogenase iron-sulfur subunit